MYNLFLVIPGDFAPDTVYYEGTVATEEEAKKWCEKIREKQTASWDPHGCYKKVEPTMTIKQR